VKKLLICGVLVSALMVSLLACCGGVQTYTDSSQTIDIGVNQEFVIALDSNPTTGYGWQESYDENMFELVEKTYEEAEQDLVGAGGVEYFRFKALETGETEITLVYTREWEEPTPEDITEVFTVSIK